MRTTRLQPLSLYALRNLLCIVESGLNGAGKSGGFFRLIGHPPGGADRITFGDEFPSPPRVLETSDDG